MSRTSSDLWVCHLGLVPYSDGLAIQGELRERRQAGELPDTLLLLEHPPTYTHGRRSGAQDLPMPEGFYRDKGIAVHATDRGGKVTYHSPGQLVGYPIMRIDDVDRYLRTIEQAVIAALGEEGVHGRSRRDEGIDYTGVWVGDRKIASIGVHVSRAVTTHGFAVNVDMDLDPFSRVIACGLPDVVMTSLALEAADRSRSISDRSMRCFRRRMAYSFAHSFSRRQRLVSPSRLGIGAANGSLPKPAPVRNVAPKSIEEPTAIEEPTPA